MFRLLIVVIFGVSFTPGIGARAHSTDLAAVSYASPQAFLEFSEERILFDLRKPLGGNGDTASAMFFLQNLFERGYQGRVDLLVDDKSSTIFNTITRGMQTFSQRLHLVKLEDLSREVYTMVFRSGQPSGRLNSLGLNRTGKNSPAQPGLINVDGNTIFVVLTIYGNSRNKYSVQAQSLISRGDEYHLLPALGLELLRGSDREFFEMGIFRDPFSQSIRHWSLEQVEAYVRDFTSQSDPRFHEFFQRLIRLRSQQNIRYGLAYGFSIPIVRDQAVEYFRGLLNSPTPTVIVTPSVFSEQLYAQFTPQEQQEIEVTRLSDLDLSDFRKGRHLTIVQIPNAPHVIFSSLLLASKHNGVVPMGAGDGFFTTALSLGVPFAPTRVDWNIRNIRNLARLLSTSALEHRYSVDRLRTLHDVFSPEANAKIHLSKAQTLMSSVELFEEVLDRIPDPLSTVLQALKHRRKRGPKPARMEWAKANTIVEANARAGDLYPEKYGASAVSCLNLFKKAL